MITSSKTLHRMHHRGASVARGISQKRL